MAKQPPPDLRILNGRLNGELPPAFVPSGALTQAQKPRLRQLSMEGDQAGGSAQKALRRVDVALTTAFGEGSGTAAGNLVLNVRGNVLMAMNSTLATDVCEVKLNDDGDFIPIGAGAGIFGVAFERLTIRNLTAQAGSVLTLVYTTDRPGDRLLLRYR